MALQQGTRLGAYEVLSFLGVGGMGEVYRARDTKLQRDVALKILPDTMARDAQRMARFEREARTLASLNHPNIAAIYGLEESNGVRALVMELVEGETLAERIDHPDATVGAGLVPAQQGRPQGSPLQEPLPIARQIAEALEYAHERGVIHRDLKPANVKITPEGTVKVLDFGLAKVLTGQDSSTTLDVNNSPTLSTMATQAGMILGTAAYMSPEQAKGQRVDRRADIWAFGCVLYEMLAGRKVFEGETISDVLAAVIRAEPDWTAIPEATPPSIQRLIRRCLQKDQRQRLQAIGEARIAIEETISGVGAGLVPALAETAQGQPQGSPLRRALPWAAGLLVGALISGLVFWEFAFRAPKPQPVVSFTVPPPENTVFPVSGSFVSLSPNGQEVAFVTQSGSNGLWGLWVRALDSLTARQIEGTSGAFLPFWSPDGGSLGFFASGKLKTVSLANGTVQVLADASCWGNGGAWSPGGTILYTPSCDSPLDRISASGGKPAPATKRQKGIVNDGLPTFLPDGRHFLYVPNAYIPSPTHSIWMGSLDSSERKLVLKDADSPEFASGHLLFKRDSRVFAQPFDPATGKVSGKAVALAEALRYSVSSSGVLAYQGGTPVGRMEWFDRNGSSLGSVGPVALYQDAEISPDGKRVLADVVDPQSSSSDIWSYPAGGGPGTRLTFGPGFKMFSVWSPDGKYIAYSCHQSNGKWGICRKPADGSGAEERLVTLETPWAQAFNWSPDGRYFSLQELASKENRFEVCVLPLFGDRKPFRPAPIKAQQGQGTFSPDGRWLAYMSTETGRPEVYVVSFPGLGAKFQISQNGGSSPRWDKRGHLYFEGPGGRLVEADLENEPEKLLKTNGWPKKRTGKLAKRTENEADHVVENNRASKKRTENEPKNGQEVHSLAMAAKSSVVCPRPSSAMLRNDPKRPAHYRAALADSARFILQICALPMVCF